MPRVAATYRGEFPVAAPVPTAVAFFADLDQLVALGTDIAEARTLGPETICVRLQEQHHGVTRYTGRYTTTYRADGDRVRWTSAPEGTMWLTGTARFLPAAGGARLHYEETVEMELDAPRPLVAMLRPIASRLVEREIKAFVERMLAALARRRA